MPYYDFYCKECKEEVEEFFKIADKKEIECSECGNQMKQIIITAPGLSNLSRSGRSRGSVEEKKKDKEYHEEYVTYAREKVSSGEWFPKKKHK